MDYPLPHGLCLDIQLTPCGLLAILQHTRCLIAYAIPRRGVINWLAPEYQYLYPTTVGGGSYLSWYNGRDEVIEETLIHCGPIGDGDTTLPPFGCGIRRDRKSIATLGREQCVMA